jgi:polyhydroxyalkanoate synthesis repressor PhaR
MQIIKKYANRKLYHTNQKRYITLEGIAQLVQAGEHIQVYDNETGDDITAAILMQGILQARERQAEFPPVSVLTSLIQLGGDALAHVQRSIIDALSGHDHEHIDADILLRLDMLVDDGSLDAGEAARLRRLLLRPDIKSAADHTTPPEAGLPTRSDLARLSAQLDALALAVERLVQQRIPREHQKPDDEETPERSEYS